jgi:hypothetical protein
LRWPVPCWSRRAGSSVVSVIFRPAWWCTCCWQGACSPTWATARSGAGWRPGWTGRGVAAPTASALTQARRRLGPGPLRELFFLLRGPSPAAARWRGLLVCAIDGTIMSVAGSAANLAVYAKQRGGRNGNSGYPMLRLLVLVSCGTRTVIDAVFGPASAGETAYAANLVRSLHAGMLLLALCRSRDCPGRPIRSVGNTRHQSSSAPA